MTEIAKRYRHKKRGSEYTTMGLATLQTDVPITDMTMLVIYGAKDGTMWARPLTEFFDGRFEEIKS